MPLSEALTLAAIHTLADEKTFQRGLAYFHEGAVGKLEADDEEVEAVVQGTHRYHVMLAAGPDDGLEHECDCPVGEGGVFCKHAVALALAWLETVGEEVFPPPEPGKPRRKRTTKAEQIRRYLDTLGEHELRTMLIEAAERDGRLRDKLLFAAKANAGSDVASLRAAVRQATRVSGFLDWREAGGYAAQLDELADLLEKRIGDGNVRLVELIEEAIAEAEGSLQQIDDSNGQIYAAIERLAHVHQLACGVLRPDPLALAERLFTYQMEGEWDTFHEVIPAYRDALGGEGLACYRRLVEERWAALPPLPPADRHVQRWDSDRFRVEQAMEALAKLSGDVEAIAAIKAKDLSSPRRFLALATLYRDHQRFDEALDWAEKGIAAFSGGQIHELLGFAIDEQVRRGEPARAEELCWERFRLDMGCRAFLLLLDDAGRIGRREALREKGLAALRERVKEEEKRPDNGKRQAWLPSARSELLAIFLAERDGEEAWSTLKGGPTDMRLWDKAAALRGETHPEEAIDLYFRLLPKHVEEGARNARYAEAAATVRAIRELRLGQGEEAKFARELDGIRREYKAKRNFIKALADLG